MGWVGFMNDSYAPPAVRIWDRITSVPLLQNIPPPLRNAENS